MKRVRDADLPKFDKIRCYQSEHEIYRNNMDRISEMKLEMTAVSGVTTSGIPAGANYIANKISPPKKKKDVLDGVSHIMEGQDKRLYMLFGHNY